MKRGQFLQTSDLGLAISAAALLFMAHVTLTPAHAMEGTLADSTVPSTNVPGPVAITYYLPKNYDAKRAEPYPLLIQLHGGLLAGSNKEMGSTPACGSGCPGGMGGLLDEAINKGLAPPIVSVMPSAAPSFYMNHKDGSQKWEDFVVNDLLSHMRKNFNVAQGRHGTLITGIALGGLGALRIAVKHPEVFQAVAALEPAIEPALSYDEITLRDKINPRAPFAKQIFGDPIDKEFWAANNPATIIKKDPSRLLGLGIYLDVGDQDFFYIDQGTEFVHRLLFDAGISHEYRLVKGGDHAGASLGPRNLDALAFIGRQLNPPGWIDDIVLKARGAQDANKKALGYPVTPYDPNRIHTE
jgi:S-formylglutathione hydrolase